MQCIDSKSQPDPDSQRQAVVAPLSQFVILEFNTIPGWYSILFQDGSEYFPFLINYRGTYFVGTLFHSYPITIKKPALRVAYGTSFIKGLNLQDGFSS